MMRMTQAELADAADLGQSTLSQYETGKFTPRDDHKEALAEALGAPVDRVFPWDDMDRCLFCGSVDHVDWELCVARS